MTSAPCILVIDPDAPSAAVARDELIAAGYCVDITANGAEALHRMREAPRPALIVMDVLMPVMGGLETLLALRADPLLADIPVVLRTSFPFLAGEARAFDGLDVLPKAGRPGALATSAARHLARSASQPG